MKIQWLVEQMGCSDRHLRQAFPKNAGDSLGGIPAIFFGDFSQLPPIGDTPLYTTTSSARKHALTMEGRCVFESFNKSVTLDRKVMILSRFNFVMH